MKKGSIGKILYVILFTCSRGVRKSLFRCSRLKDTRIMMLCLCHVEMIVCNRSFFRDFLSLYIVKKSDTRKILPSIDDMIWFIYLTSRQLATAILPCPEEHGTTHKQNKWQYTQSTKNNLQTQRTVATTKTYIITWQH